MSAFSFEEEDGVRSSPHPWLLRPGWSNSSSEQPESANNVNHIPYQNVAQQDALRHWKEHVTRHWDTIPFVVLAYQSLGQDMIEGGAGATITISLIDFSLS